MTSFPPFSKEKIQNCRDCLVVVCEIWKILLAWDASSCYGHFDINNAQINVEYQSNLVFLSLEQYMTSYKRRVTIMDWNNT